MRNGQFGKLFRRRHKPEHPFLLSRPSSFPLISGDTFRSVAEVIVEAGQVRHRSALSTGVVFASMDSLFMPNGVERICEAASATQQPATARLVLHNGDQAPQSSQVRKLLTCYRKIFSVNAVDGIEKVVPIPIGLENASRNKNGRLHYYLDAIENPTDQTDRTRLVLSSFHTSTRPDIRGPLRKQVKASPHNHEDRFFKSLDYRREVRNSLFVLSPPGNGDDCHRTWEAIYLGAVPVVLSSHLAGSLRAELPIHAVDDYREFLSLGKKELTELYMLTRQKSTEWAFAMYWLSQILDA